MTQIQNLITPKITIIADIIIITIVKEAEAEMDLNIAKEVVAEIEKEANTEGVIKIK